MTGSTAGRAWLVAAALTVAAMVPLPAAAQQGIDFDLRDWTKQGPDEVGDWQVASDGSEVVQQLNDDPTYFVSPETVASGTITGVFEVQTTSDDDYIGFVFGYRGPTTDDPFAYDHLLFDWKGASQGGFGDCTSEEGFALTRIRGQLSEEPDERREGNGMVLPVNWCHEQAEDDPRAKVLATDWGEGRGWEANTEYAFALDYAPDRVRIRIDGETIFDVAGDFPEGSFGFYNYSQKQVRYSGFRAGPTEPEERLSGEDRFDTSVAISQDAWADGAADAVVLTRSDVFADALAGTPLAVSVGGPLLITDRDQLVPAVRDEIRRALGSDTSKTVHLLGGPVALSAEVESAVRALGYRTQRLAGEDRIETAIRIARELPTIDAFLVTTGYNFPDALAAGPAAVQVDGAVLLSVDGEPAPATVAFMDGRPDVPRYAIGGPAANAHPEATPVFGPDRIRSTVAVAEEFFDAPGVAGLARADDFPDSLAGGAHVAMGLPELGRAGGPMLLTPTTELAGPVESWLCDHADTLEHAFVYGGSVAVSDGVGDQAQDRVDGKGC